MGRNTGIPTIQNVLKANGSPRAIVVTDEERAFFRITIPCHEAVGNIIADIASKDNHDPKDDPKDDPKGLSERQLLMLDLTKKKIREEQGLLQRQLAAVLEIDTPLFGKIERGERRAKREQAIKLAEYLHQDK